ncbi:hypothetical protein ACWD2L_10675 [Streptomyces sp. NPDC002754]
MGDTRVVPERRRLGRSLTWTGFLLLFVTLLVYAIHAQSTGSWAPWDTDSARKSEPHATAPPVPTDDSSDGSSMRPTGGASATPGPSESPSSGAPAGQEPPAPPAYEAPAEPTASSNSTAEIIKAVAYLIGAVGGVASTLLGQIMLMRGRRQEATSEPATSVRTPQ